MAGMPARNPKHVMLRMPRISAPTARPSLRPGGGGGRNDGGGPPYGENGGILLQHNPASGACQYPRARLFQPAFCELWVTRLSPATSTPLFLMKSRATSLG